MSKETTRPPSNLASTLPSTPCSISSAAVRTPHARERRASSRVAFPTRMLVAWTSPGAGEPRSPMPGLAETCRLVDIGFGGFRLGSLEPVAVGRRGRAIHILPERTRVDLDVEVVWTSEVDDGWEFGVKIVET